MADLLKPQPIQIAIIGAGMAGRAFARACFAAGFPVVLEDVMPERLRRAEYELESELGTRLGRQVRLVTTVEDAVQDADLVIDFVPDELESKLEIWALLDRMAPPRTVLCTPSDALSITDLASCTYRADRCVMVRGRIQPGARLRLLRARETSQGALDVAASVFAALGCVAVAEPDPDLPQLLKNMNAATLL